MGRKPTRDLARLGSSLDTIDNMLYKRAINCSLGEIVTRRESSENVRSYLVDTMIIDAIMGLDIELIDKLVHRIDGSVPKEDSYDKYANLFGRALDLVLDMKVDEQVTISPTDNVLIAMAKAAVYVALTTPSNSVQKMKQKHAAIDMVLDRTGGRKTAPRMLESVTVYEKPSWMTLPSAGDTYIVDDTDERSSHESEQRTEGEAEGIPD